MPRILEMKTEGNDIWVRVEQYYLFPSPLYLWTQAEAKEHQKQAIRDFLSDLGDKFIEQNYLKSSENDNGD